MLGRLRDALIVRTYSGDELQHERMMARLGEERVHARLAKSKQNDRLSITVPGRTLMRRFVTPIRDCLALWRKKPPVTNGWAEPYGDVRHYLDEVTPEVAAMLTVQVVIDGIHRTRTLQTLSSALGRAIEDEYRCIAMKRADPSMWADIEQRTRKNRPVSRRRRIFKFGHFHTKADGTPLIPPVWPNREKMRLGLVLIQATLATTDLLEVGDEAMPWGRSRRVVFPTLKTLQWIESAEDRWAAASATYLPTIEPPMPWDGPEGGGYLTDLVLRRPIARFHHPAQRAALEEPGREPPNQTYRALNVLQACAWRVNDVALEVVEAVWDAGAGVAGLPPREDIPLPPKPHDIATNDVAKKAYSRAAVDIHRRNHELRSERGGVAMHRVNAGIMRDHRTFFYPHRLDFRGRAYPTVTGLSPQGPDVCRSLIRFATEDPIDEQGRRWLMIHGANCFGAKGTLSARAAEGERLARDVASRVFVDPLDARDLWVDASEPFQFMAWCLEVGDPDRRTTGLPCHVDASNNGLQILSLLAGDRELARLTNVLPNAEPCDIYTTVAKAVTASLEEDTSLTAKAWLSVMPNGEIPRACTKRPVMTLPYGVTHWSAQQYVRDWCEEEGIDATHFPDGKHKAYLFLALRIMSEVKKACTSALEVMKWLRTCSNLITAEGAMPQWTAPSGWPVVQHYQKGGKITINAPLACSVNNMTIRDDDNAKTDPRGHRQGIAPNFVHSIDASVLAVALDGWDGPIAAIHDSFATTAPKLPALIQRLRHAVVACLIDRQPLEEFARDARARFRLDIPDPPAQLGGIGAHEVLRSEYLFS